VEPCNIKFKRHKAKITLSASFLDNMDIRILGINQSEV
jgi:hypothetical protein